MKRLSPRCIELDNQDAVTPDDPLLEAAGGQLHHVGAGVHDEHLASTVWEFCRTVSRM